MNKGKKVSPWVLAVVLAVIIIAILEVIYYESHVNSRLGSSIGVQPTAEINGRKIDLEIVATTSAMMMGLSNRDSLDADSGMLFVYNNYVMPGFWMKDMRFPIDIIWIRDNKIIGAQENAPVTTTTPLPVYYPSAPINFVLEVNAGFVRDNNIKMGDSAIFKNLK